jgi:hypothetical protein
MTKDIQIQWLIATVIVLAIMLSVTFWGYMALVDLNALTSLN